MKIACYLCKRCFHEVVFRRLSKGDFMYCKQKGCRNHKGEEYFQTLPEWVIETNDIYELKPFAKDAFAERLYMRDSGINPEKYGGFPNAETMKKYHELSEYFMAHILNELL